MAQVVLEKLTKKYDEVVAVDCIDLHVRDQELIVLVGPSGCGKSTTLRTVAGLEEITSGQIRIGERVVNHVAPKDRNIAMVFQNYALYPHMNVFKNMAFGLKMRSIGKSEIEERIRRAAGILGIVDLLHRKPAQLSGGQRQRVAVGRAIVRNPDVFLFDEPLSNLDAKLRVTMRTELVKLHRRLETTMIYVTHDQVEAMTMGDRIVVMQDGTIQQVGPPLEVYDSPANRFVAEFIGSPPMNFLEGTLVVDEDGMHVNVDNTPLKLPQEQLDRYAAYSGKKVSVGIRPEDISSNQSDLRKQGLWSPLRAKVLSSQLLGADSILQLACGDNEFMARVDPHETYGPRREIDVQLNMSKSHLFDPNTGKVL
jgi:multiple sugar transport system ATP-binding protein